MASPPNVLDELPWLKTAQHNRRKAQLWRHSRSLALLGILTVPMIWGEVGYKWFSGVPGSPSEAADQTVSGVIDAPFAPKALRPLSSDQAAEWNSKIPEADAIAAATPFLLRAHDGLSSARSLQCMTSAIYYEAANEPIDGQRAVAQVILNRVRSPNYPNSICGVVYQGSERKTGCQFTFTCDGSLSRTPSQASWARASMVASAALGGYVHAPVGWATHYHADYVVPYWAQSLQKLTTIGRHIFYGWKGVRGHAAAFNSRYAGIEPVVGDATNLIATAPPPLATDPMPGIVRVTSSERPLITFSRKQSDTPVSASASATAKNTPTATHQSTETNARWVIGANGYRTASRYPQSQITIPLTPQSEATAMVKAEAHPASASQSTEKRGE